ncbi:MAG: hypothetical protein AAF570_22410, partial [Bacteroidota bacterium]
GTTIEGASQLYKDAMAARTKGATTTRGNAVFHDDYAADAAGDPKEIAKLNPPLQNPQDPLGSTFVFEFDHYWYAGSRTTGSGVKISEHKGKFYSDHGEYTDLKSPV